MNWWCRLLKMSHSRRYLRNVDIIHRWLLLRGYNLFLLGHFDKFIHFLVHNHLLQLLQLLLSGLKFAQDALVNLTIFIFIQNASVARDSAIQGWLRRTWFIIIDCCLSVGIRVEKVSREDLLQIGISRLKSSLLNLHLRDWRGWREIILCFILRYFECTCKICDIIS